MVGILIFFIFNIVTIHMLVDVYTTKTLGSYQEVAYSISRGNRGYIFLISAMKAIYLAITASFCLEFCASYLTTLIGVYTGLPESAFAKWGIYIACLVLFSCILLWIFLGATDECFMVAKYPSRGLFYSAIASIVLLVILLVLYWTVPSFREFMADQYCKNGYSQSSQVGESGNAIEVSLGYLPTLAYCNMFTLFYLETIQQTKLAEFKKKKDLNLGYRINYLILIFYMTLFGALLVAQFANRTVTGEGLPPEC